MCILKAQFSEVGELSEGKKKDNQAPRTEINVERRPTGNDHRTADQ